LRPIAASATRALDRSHDCNWGESTFVLTNGRKCSIALGKRAIHKIPDYP
jgi:hypothetical protein